MRKKNILTAAILSMALLAGCQKEDEGQAQNPIIEEIHGGSLADDSSGEAAQGGESQGEESQGEISQGEVSPEEESPNTQQPEIQESEPPQPASTENAAKAAEFNFAALSDRVFYFSSGVGAWSTELRINSDGTFKGNYHDADMGDSGDDYPNGTLYLCGFTGKFSNLEKVDEFTYKMKLASLEFDDEPEKEEIVDGVRQIYSTAYGLDDGKDFCLYLPGAKLSDLPEMYRSWVGYYSLENTTETELPFYGLYNIETGDGFSSTVYEEQSLSERIEMEISFAEEQDAELQAKLQEDTAQADMNATSAELFQVWDNTLNIVWKLLESELDDAVMDNLRTEERNWIAAKEAAVKSAGQKYEGGSMQSMEESIKAAELTKERVYELAKYEKSALQ